MREREHWDLALTFSGMMYVMMEAEYQEGKLDLDDKMRRVKDLAAYSLSHSEILYQREGIELLALARLFGLTNDDRFQKNQERLSLLTEEALTYRGQAEKIEQEIRERQGKKERGERNSGFQRRLL